MKILVRMTTAGELPERARVLIPADGDSLMQFNDARFSQLETIKANLTKSRNPGFHRYAHALGKLAVENCEAFEGLGSHEALKRLQLESGKGCDTLMISIEGMQVPYRIPRSMAFDKMDDLEFKDVMVGIADHLRKRYLHDATSEELDKIIDDLLYGGGR